MHVASASAISLRRALLVRILDPVVIGLVILIIWYFREGRFPSAQEWGGVALVLGGAALTLHGTGAYQVLLHGGRLSVWCTRAIAGLALALAALLAVAYAVKQSEVLSRTVVGGGFLGAALVLCALRFIAHRRMLAALRSGQGSEGVVLVGQPEHALSLSRHLKRHPELGLRPVAIVSQEIQAIAGQTATFLNGSIEDLPRLVDQHRANRVIICGALGDQSTILQCLRLLSGTSVEVHYAPDYSSVPIFLFRANDFAGRPIIDLSGTPWSDGDRMVKWLEDKVLALVILTLIALPMAVIAILVKLTSSGPAVFWQERDGLNGRSFRIYKFRTMKEGPLPESLPEPTPVVETDSDEYDPFESGAGEQSRTDAKSFRQVQSRDPRITRLGSFLRKTSLDELPQFWNVLKGDMSIVGPRPHATGHNRQYLVSIGELMRRHHVKPGITGLAQISGARGQTPNTQSMRDRLRYDLEYIQSWSLWLDLKIIALTVLRGFYNRQP